ncbi:MAG: nickel pincer cofactor biosynthesis protein LarC [Dethiobacteria bacterium]|nr:nickel pincer cofactor biosynthesis protein LarC [Bacillota bacterium]
MSGALCGDKVAYFDCFSGISGDMILGALIDCGLELRRLQELLSGLKLSGYRLEAKKVSRYGLAGTDVQVVIEHDSPRQRHLPEIKEMIRQSDLPAPVKENSAAVFENLAAAEAEVHGVSIDEVHFHEVGAVDAIVDIVGCAGGLHLLRIGRLYCSPLPIGGGTVRSAHGLLPLPAPAVMQLLQRRRVPVYGRETRHELVTPTGAAIVTTLAAAFGPPPSIELEAVGYGSGKLDPGYANYLRIFTGSSASSSLFEQEPLQVIEANIDDLNPEIYGYLMERLFAEGAWDVYYTPVQMKKNRPAVKLTVLAPPQRLNRLVETVFYETSTMGLRVWGAQKFFRRRNTEIVETEWGPVRVKLVPDEAGGEGPLQYAVEYEDCSAIARRTGIPLKEIYRRVELSFRMKRRQASTEE